MQSNAWPATAQVGIGVDASEVTRHFCGSGAFPVSLEKSEANGVALFILTMAANSLRHVFLRILSSSNARGLNMPSRRERDRAKQFGGISTLQFLLFGIHFRYDHCPGGTLQGGFECT